jgi:Mlc titration factor MtfA (ptsG expression regulator)
MISVGDHREGITIRQSDVDRIGARDGADAIAVLSATFLDDPDELSGGHVGLDPGG